ncbi:nitrous oxide-stimulated promoter family protein [Enorma phocaeensis]|uniref:nitrous oxide-stimulated promoter family protein n=1 Tax=Enorma phocaeensis TaxID=1871019 RepID=UPI00315DD282
MSRTPDTPAVARRRERERRVISQMIALYCRKQHRGEPRDASAFCGEPVCADCAELDAFAVRRTERCPHMATKTSCNKCSTHCYPPAMQERIRAVMRFAGPRMLLHHPVAAVRHILGR